MFVTSKCFLVPITTALSTRIYYRTLSTVSLGMLLPSVGGWLSKTYWLPIKSQPIFITQAFGLCHSIAYWLVCLETKIQLCDALRYKITLQILENRIGELLNKKMNYWTSWLSCTSLRTNYQTTQQVLVITLHWMIQSL